MNEQIFLGSRAAFGFGESAQMVESAAEARMRFSDIGFNL